MTRWLPELSRRNHLAGGFLAAKASLFPLLGWLWYLIMLLPVIGLVQVGLQSMADRYTDLPSIGLYVALAGEAGSSPGASPAGMEARGVRGS